MSKRKNVTFTIREDLMKEFREACDKKGLVMSRRVEKCIENDVEKISIMEMKR